MENNYKDLIFTHHAVHRMRERSIAQDSIWQVVHNPDRSHPEEKPNTTRFIRTINDRTYHVVATYLPDQDKTLIISTWVRGEDDTVPLVWQLITLPFTLSYKLLMYLLKKRANN